MDILEKNRDQQFIKCVDGKLIRISAITEIKPGNKNEYLVACNSGYGMINKNTYDLLVKTYINVVNK